jgi:hypothetical protein
MSQGNAKGRSLERQAGCVRSHKHAELVALKSPYDKG